MKRKLFADRGKERFGGYKADTRNRAKNLCELKAIARGKERAVEARNIRKAVFEDCE